MDLFGRYVFKQAASALFLIMISLTAIIWLATALRELKLVTSQGQSAWLFLKMTALAMPNLMAVIAPVALLIACFHTLNRLSTDSELIVMNAAGSTIWRIAKPYVLLSIIICGLLFISNLYVMPASMRALRDFVTQVRTDLISQVLQPGRFSSPEKGLTFHIRGRDRSDNLLGLVVHDQRDGSQTMSYLANTARIVKRNDMAFLVMNEGQIHRQKKGEEGVQVIEFEKYLFNVSQFGEETGQVHYKPRERYLHELLNPDPKDPLFRHKPGKFRAEIHERLSNPLYPILFVMVAVAALGPARTTRQGRLQTIFIGFAVAAGLRVCGLAATNLLSLHPSAVILVYGIPIGGIIAAAWFAHARMTPQSRSILDDVWGAISQTFERLTASMGRGAQGQNK